MADIEDLKRAVAVSPDNVPLLVLLADAYLEQFSPAEALEHYQHALELDPNHVGANLGVVVALAQDGRTSEAILRVEALCSRFPDLGAAWKQRARLAMQEEDSAAARSAYERAVELDPSMEDPDLLRRIEGAGGKPRPKKVDPPEPSAPASNNSWQAGAMYDPESEEDDDDDDDEDADMLMDFLHTVDTKFEDVGGMEEVKKDIRMKILLPLQNKKLFETFGKKAGGGVLLYGPPGCGKTLISRATAGEIDANFFSIGLHQVLEMWIGRSEQKLHEIFELARDNRPSVLFFDEIDALAADRRDMRTSAGRTLINQFLAELDGNINANEEVLILGATNAPWHLDSAFLRPGRFDRVIFVPPPDEPARKEIIDIMAKGKPVNNLDTEALAKKTANFSGADIKAIFDRAIEEALEQSMERGEIVPVENRDLMKARKAVKPSTVKWFESAKNYALYSNQSGFYDDVLEHLGIKK